MPRWTQTHEDRIHLSRVNQDMPVGGIVEITLTDGIRIEGVLHRFTIGNNAGHNGWQYYGECEVQNKSGQLSVVDYMDIETAKNAWSPEKAREYESLGLIQVEKT